MYFSTCINTIYANRLYPLTKVGGFTRRDEDDKKKNHIPSKTLSKDAYFQYVKYIAPHIKNNPFLPRVYKVRIEKDTTGELLPEYTLEKLVHLQDVDLNTLKSVCRSAFGNAQDDSIEKFDTKRECIRVLEYSMRDAIEHKSAPKYIKNKKLLQALDIIRELSSKQSFSYDLHSENIMLRITPIGAQIVLTDPLS